MSCRFTLFAFLDLVTVQGFEKFGIFSEWTRYLWEEIPPHLT